MCECVIKRCEGVSVHACANIHITQAYVLIPIFSPLSEAIYCISIVGLSSLYFSLFFHDAFGSSE